MKMKNKISNLSSNLNKNKISAWNVRNLFRKLCKVEYLKYVVHVMKKNFIVSNAILI